MIKNVKINDSLPASVLFNLILILIMVTTVGSDVVTTGKSDTWVWNNTVSGVRSHLF